VLSRRLVLLIHRRLKCVACLLQLAPKVYRISQCTTDQKAIANPVAARSDAEPFAGTLSAEICPILCAAARRRVGERVPM
jgi:hypothetical protein